MRAKSMTNKEYFLATANAIVFLGLTACFMVQVYDQVTHTSSPS